MDRARDLGCALDAARAACRAVAAVGSPADFGAEGVLEKGAAGPLTLADLASQVAAIASLRAAFGPSARFVAEESADEVASHGGEPLLVRVAEILRASGMAIDAAGVREALSSGGHEGGSDRFWAIDPLDGTKGYLRGGQFAIAIALVEAGRPVVGVLGLPRLAGSGCDAGSGVLASAVSGSGAHQRSLAGGDAVPIRAREWSSGQAVRLAGSVEKAHSASDALETLVSALGPVDPVRVDSQAKYALVARGDADAYVRRSPSAGYREWIWDHAAGALVATESGCIVTDTLGTPLDFAQGRRLERSTGIVCAPQRLHGALVDILARGG
jgi:3'(2'), 5'-bisphosphate nucleotidase